jgi:RimJ/RimL family protein N-acetyltransferase
MQEVVTERLSIRPFSLDDAPLILHLLNEPSFLRNIGDRGVRDLVAARKYLEQGPLASYATYGFGMWRLALRADDTPIGMVGLLKRAFLDDIDVGYALLPEFCGAGYAFEAAAAVVAYARETLGVGRLLAIVSPGNEPSIRLLHKLGFADAGTVRMPGEDSDVLLFSLRP